MKKTKRILMALLTVFAVAQNYAQVAIPSDSDDFDYNGFGYVYAAETGNEVFVCNYSARGAANLSKIEIPEKVKDGGKECVVVGVHQGAFSNLLSLKEVILPETVKEIKAYAFTNYSQEFGMHVGLTELEVINLNKVETIGTKAFYGCKTLKSIELESVKEISANAFSGTGLTSLTLPNGVTVGTEAFANTEIKSLKLDVELSATGVFNGCKYLSNVEFGSNVKTISTGLLANTGVTEVTIPASVTTIENKAFEGCSNLTVNFVSSPSIANDAFPSTAKLNLTITDNVTFTNANANTFDNITYAREFSSQKFATLILPFVPDQFDQLEVYKMAELNSNSLVFQQVDKFVPGTPYLVKVKEGEEVEELTGTDTQLALSSVNNTVTAGDWVMKGQYVPVTLNGATGDKRYYYYRSSDNSYVYAEGNLAVNPFRTYIEAPKTAGAPQVRMVTRGLDGEETAIDMIEMEDVLTPAVEAYYTLTGVRVLEPVKGNMYIVNGKKVIF